MKTRDFRSFPGAEKRNRPNLRVVQPDPIEQRGGEDNGLAALVEKARVVAQRAVLVALAEELIADPHKVTTNADVADRVVQMAEGIGQ